MRDITSKYKYKNNTKYRHRYETSLVSISIKKYKIQTSILDISFNTYRKDTGFPQEMAGFLGNFLKQGVSNET